jgi:hypothetical protein
LRLIADKILAQLGKFCKKKLVFATPLLPFRSIGEAYAQTTYLANPTHIQTPLLQKELFFSSHIQLRYFETNIKATYFFVSSYLKRVRI